MDADNQPKTLAEACEELTASAALLTEAQSNIAKLNADIETARLELVTASEKADIQAAEIADLQSKAVASETLITSANEQIAVLNGQLEAAKADTEAAKVNVERLESLCAVRGIDPKGAVGNCPNGTENPAEAFAAITDPVQRTIFFRDNKAAIMQARGK
jgi:septal ring factor EnvC (AmiA/AmiB activator)